MHDDTDFIGRIRVSPPLKDEEVDFLLDLADSGRTLRSTPTGRGNSDVPFARLAWDVCLRGCCLWWTGEEEDRWIGPTLQFLVDHWFRSGAVGEGHPKHSVFTFDHVLDGLLVIRGRHLSTLVEVASNVVTWRQVAEPCGAMELVQPRHQPWRAPQQPTVERPEAQRANPYRDRALAALELPDNVIELKPRQHRDGGGAAG